MELVTREGNLQDALVDYSAEHLLRYKEYKRFVEDDLDC
jgi:hypothetical protein